MSAIVLNTLNLKKGAFLACIGVLLLTLFANIGVSLDLTDATAIYENYSGGSIWDRSNQVFINNMSKSGTVPVVSEGITTNSSIGSFTNGYYYQDNLALWSSSENFSISLWAEMKATSDYGSNNAYFISYDEVDTLDLWISYTAPYIFRFQTSKCDTISSSSALYVSVGSWNLITATYDGTNGVCKIYINESVHGSVGTGAGGTNKNTKITVGHYSDRIGGKANDWIFNQITFWNKTLTVSDIAWLYNNGMGQNWTIGGGVPTWVFVNNVYPENNTINTTTNDIDFGYLPNASREYVNCSLYFGLANNTANWNMSNETAINNNTINTFSISDLLNGSYKWYASCCIEGDVCNSSVDYYLNVSIAYPIVTYGNCTLYSLPTDWTNAYCLNNATLYHEKIYSLSGVTCNYSEFLECPFGCKVRSCNPSTFDMWLQNGALLIGALVALLLIFMVGRKAKGIRF
jgi:hypothetical protein